MAFRVTAGPDAGKTGRGITGADGKTVFSFSSQVAGTETLEADITRAGGGTLSSNPVTVTWSSPLSLVLAPSTSTHPLGETAALVATLTDAGGRGVANVPVSFLVTSGPDAGKSGPGVTNSGFGTVVAVLDDGAGLVSRTAVRQATPAATADASAASTAPQ